MLARVEVALDPDEGASRRKLGYDFRRAQFRQDAAEALGRLAGGLPEGATIVLTRGIRSSMPVIPLPWAVARRLEYGDTLVLVCRRG